ncbi:MAG: hypothetical protein JWP17_3270, partial [Solirubrobacterales bacterium]|nr:hypothetical protein [Solirubrobacterales bacterium]
MTELALVPQPRTDRLPSSGRPQIDVVVPVYNEEGALASSVLRLHRFLSDAFPFR